MTRSFYHFPTDAAWRQTRATQLDLPFPNERDVSAQENTYGIELSNPSTCHHVLGDGNCFFSSLSYVITGQEHYQHVLRHRICQHLLNHQEELKTYLPSHYNGDVQQYLVQSRMESNATWATEVEIFTAAHMLRTNIFVYTQHGDRWTWLKHSVGQPEGNTSIYLYHQGRCHYDVVLGITRSDTEQREQNNRRERERYFTDPMYRDKKKTQAQRTYDSEFRDTKKMTLQQRYSSDESYRENKKITITQRDSSDESYREMHGLLLNELPAEIRLMEAKMFCDLHDILTPEHPNWSKFCTLLKGSAPVGTHAVGKGFLAIVEKLQAMEHIKIGWYDKLKACFWNMHDLTTIVEIWENRIRSKWKEHRENFGDHRGQTCRTAQTTSSEEERKDRSPVSSTQNTIDQNASAHFWERTKSDATTDIESESDQRDNNGLDVLLWCCRSGDVKLFDYLVEKGAKPDTRTSNGLTCLMIAALHKHFDLTRHIVDKYPEQLEQRDTDGLDVLLMCCRGGDVKLFDYLIEIGVKPDTRTSNGLSCLMIAALRNFDLTRHIVDKYPEQLEQRDTDGLDVLLMCCRVGDVKLFDYLIEKGVKPDTRSTNGLTCLMIAAMEKHYDLTRHIVDKYPEQLEQRDINGFDVLLNCCQGGDVKLFIYLIEKGVKPDTRASNGLTCLLIAALKKHFDLTRHIVDKYPEQLEQRDGNGFDVLLTCCRSGDVKLFDYLIEKGVKPDTRASNGMTCLMIAALHKHYDLTRHITDKYPGKL